MSVHVFAKRLDGGSGGVPRSGSPPWSVRFSYFRTRLWRTKITFILGGIVLGEVTFGGIVLGEVTHKSKASKTGMLKTGMMKNYIE